MKHPVTKLLEGFNAMDVANVVIKVPLPLAAMIAVKRRIHSTLTFVVIHEFFAREAAPALLSARER